jgi:hypothetical protein
VPTRRLALVLAAFGLVVVTACSGGDIAEEIIESQEGVGDVEIDEESGEVSVETDDGNVVIGGGDIPDDFPIDVPAGGQVLGVIEQGENATVSLVYQESFEQISGYFSDWIGSSGVEVVNEFESSTPQSVVWTLQDGEQGYSISVADLGDGGVQVTLIVGDA